MSCEIVVRPARATDEPARADLVRRGLSSHRWDAFLLFFFQELTLQCCVLGGAVLFIFFGVSAGALAALLPAAAAAVAAAVHLAHAALADKHVQNIRKELFGFVAEYRGPLVADPSQLTPVVVTEQSAGEGAGEGSRAGARLVGTASVADCWGAHHAGWLNALAVHPQWRSRGAGRALVAACRAGAAARGLRSLQCVASELQPAARALLHRAGWEARGWYHRRLCGAALTLMLAHLATDLPHA